MFTFVVSVIRVGFWIVNPSHPVQLQLRRLSDKDGNCGVGFYPKLVQLNKKNHGDATLVTASTTH